MIHVKHSAWFLAQRQWSINAHGVCAVLCSAAAVVSDSLQPYGLLCLWESPGNNTGMGGRACLQEIFPTQGLKPPLLNLLHCRRVLYS